MKLRRRVRRLAAGAGARFGAAAVAGTLAAAGALGGCGHTLHRPGDGIHRYDFRAPPCRPAGPPERPLPDDAVVVRYLGAGGLFVGWRGEAILLGPFFSNPGRLELLIGRNRPDRDAISRGLDGVPVGAVGALLFGHSHYDHLADALEVSRRAPRARLYVNATGARALRHELPSRIEVLEESAGEELPLVDAAGEPLPFRVRAIRSSHAPHVGPLKFMSGEGNGSGRRFERRRYWSFKEGQSFALIVELTEGSGAAAPVRFRLLYQDSASEEPAGRLPPLAGGYDLVVTCMASAHLAGGYPLEVLSRTAPRHVLVSHYEDFLAPWGPGHGFVPLLTDRRADRFLDRVDRALGNAAAAPSPPEGDVCGPSTPRWTMPLVGEWLTFRPSHTEGRREER